MQNELLLSHGIDLRKEVVDAVGDDLRGTGLDEVIAHAGRALWDSVFPIIQCSDGVLVSTYDDVAEGLRRGWDSVDVTAIVAHLERRPGPGMWMNGEDFDRVTPNTTRWGGKDWEKQLGRFEPSSAADLEPSLKWGYAYWAEEGWAPVVLARSYLDSLSMPYQIVWDLADAGWVILTDYASLHWRTQRNVLGTTNNER